ncbi:MAG: FAD-dependent oxidoreductase [Abyssibacter sp.]|uniref:FAD-dependent oxidoreductase n=1 Tax=Abyssibacter sp. TaxID=2320200 RepID=UPI0032196FE3
MTRQPETRLPAEMNAELVIVGAGISGMAIGRELVARGRDVRLLDKGWYAGGRFASRRMAGGAALVDYGVRRFELPGAHRWWSAESIRRVRELDEGGEAMLATSARSFVEGLAEGLAIRQRHAVTRLEAASDGRWRLVGDADTPDCLAKTVVLTCPGPQTAALLASAGLAAPPAAVLQFQPRWVVTGSVPRDARIRIGELLTAMDCIERGPDVPAQGRQCLHLQGCASWSAERLDWSESDIVAVVEQGLTQAGASDLRELKAKRWRYALPEGHGESIEMERAPGLFVAGDWTQPGPAERGVDRALASAAQVVGLLIAGAA